MLLSMVHTREILEGRREGRGDTSQAQNWSNFRNARVDKVREIESYSSSCTTNYRRYVGNSDPLIWIVQGEQVWSVWGACFFKFGEATFSQ